MFKILDRYIIRKYIGTFFYALILFLSISIVIDVTENINDFLKADVSFLQAVKYYLSFMPWMAGILAPLFVFISVIFFTSKLSENSEIIAMLCGGVSFRRLLVPYMIVALFLTILFWLGTNYLIPISNRAKIDFELSYLRNKKSFQEKDFHFKNDKNWYIYIEDYNIDEQVGYKFALENIVDGKLLYKLRADRIVYDSLKNTWTVKNGYIRRNADTSEKLEFFDKFDTTFNFTPVDIYKAPETKESMTTPQIQQYVQRERDKGRGGENLKKYEIEIFDRTNIPLSTILLTLIAVSLSSRKIRGGMGMHIGFGLLLCSIYVLVMRFALIFATKGDLPPFIASSIPNLLFLPISLYLIFRAPK